MQQLLLQYLKKTLNIFMQTHLRMMPQGRPIAALSSLQLCSYLWLARGVFGTK